MLIYEGADYAVRKVFLTQADRQATGIAPPAGAAEGGPVVVTFPHAGPPTMNADLAFGEVFLRRKGIDAYHVINAKVDWFQSPDIMRALAAIRADLPPGRRIVTYGSSMGGYGALLGSGPLGAAAVLAAAPQFSIDRAAVPDEVRWKDHAARIGPFIHQIEDHISRDARIYTLHDPRNYDERQINMFAPHPHWTHLRLPYSGHTPLMVLQQSGVLTELILDICHDRMDPAAWRARLHGVRRQSRAYWRVISVHAARMERADFAWYSFAKLEALGGTPKECEGIRISIERNLDLRRRQAESRAHMARLKAEREARQALRAERQQHKAVSKATPETRAPDQTAAPQDPTP